jgi:RNase_H superfamily
MPVTPKTVSLRTPPELCAIIRESAGNPEDIDCKSVAQRMQVGTEQKKNLCSQRAEPRVACRADDRKEKGAGNGVLSAGLCCPNGDRGGVISTLHEKENVGSAFYDSGGVTWYIPLVGTQPVLAFDIETTGFRAEDTVTCVCAFDPDRGIEFSACTPMGERCDAFLQLLDEAPLLCAFNGARFDVPFIVRRWGITSERAGSWARKLVDPFEACKLALGVTFSLDKLLAANGIACKTGCGSQAVVMAREKNWAELAEYCMQDTKKTHQAIRLGRLALPGRAGHTKVTFARVCVGQSVDLKKKS